MSEINFNTASAFNTTPTNVKNISNGLGENDFLKLLAVQLQYQDPLDPMENTEFIAQMAQFSTLEGITSMSSSMAAMSEQIVSMNNLSTANLIGKTVKVFGNDIVHIEGQGSRMEYLLKEDASLIKVNIMDSNGVQIRTINIGSQNAGKSQVVWDGLDEAGLKAAGGEYTFNVVAQSINGADITAGTIISAKVDGIVYENSIPYLMLNNTMVSMDKVLEIWN